MKKIQQEYLSPYNSAPGAEFPKNAEILSVRLDQNDVPVVSYMYDVTFSDQFEYRQFLIEKSGSTVDGNISKNNFIGTVKDSLGNVFHVFEKMMI